MEEITPDDLKRCIAVLSAFVDDRTRLTRLPEADRVALMIAAGRLSRPQRHETVRLAKAFRRIGRQHDQDQDRVARATTAIRSARQQAVFSAPLRLVSPEIAPAVAHGHPADLPGPPAAELRKARACYVCKVEFTKLHFFYDSMCGPCAELNYAKRFQTVSLEGRVALITGARVKIGFQAALMMLRAGAKVIVTTRFPHDAASRFSREDDYASFQARLQIHGLDLRHCPSVEVFARYLAETEERLDILINNAAQTVRRPPGFYTHLIENELLPLSGLRAELHPVLSSHEACKRGLGGGGGLALDKGAPDATGLASWRDGGPGIGIRSPALLSQVPCAYDDDDGDVFPLGRSDADMQQIDLRTMNSWRLTLGDVPTPELLEVQLVNAVAPFILCSKLKPLMLRHRTDEKHIVNVSAVEGQFGRRTKTDKHPHTNMAKAALNMMTLTSAPDYAKDGIFMNAVDTGWVTDEDPSELAARKREAHDFQPPLDIVDGAARVCDPFVSGMLTGVHVFGKFLKDYAPTRW